MIRYRINIFRNYFFRLGALLTYWVVFTSSTGGAQIRYNSARLKQVFDMLPDTYKSEIREKSTSSPGSYFLETNLNGNSAKLVYRINKYNELDHLGVYLINDSLSNTPIREVFEYLEREFLVSALLGERYPLTREVYNKKIEVLYNGSSLENQNNNFRVPKISITENTPFRVRYDSDFFLIEWDVKSYGKLGVKIPNNYSLITEKTKDELENDILRKFEYPEEGRIVTKRPLRNQLQYYESNIYLYKGDVYSSIPELSSNKYFVVSDSIYPVFNGKYYRESISNLFMNLIPTHVIMNITQKLYGGNDKEFRINLNSFFQNFSGDYMVYFGWQNADKDNLKASVFICNTVYNYDHLLEISTNSRAVFRKNAEVKGMFYAFIPKENLEKRIY
jgi:hypothetical protein